MPFDTKSAKRSPLQQKPLRNPGESLRDEIERLFSEELPVLVVFPLVAVGLAIFEWLRWYFHIPPQPLACSSIAVVVIAYTAYDFFRLRKKYRSLALGMAGEKSVGQFLDGLHIEGGHVFHDIPAGDFNIDHVIVSPRGVYAIETKTYSKPARGETVIQYNGERILVNGIEPDRNPIRQALAARRWLAGYLFETTGKHYPVKAVALFPDWFVTPPDHKTKDTPWALNPQNLPKFIEKEPVAFKPEDVALATSRLKDFIIRHE